MCDIVKRITGKGVGNSESLKRTYLDIREEHLKHVRARVAGVEKHELGFLQVIGRETLLDLNMNAIKDINNCLEGKQLRVDQANVATDVITKYLCAC